MSPGVANIPEYFPIRAWWRQSRTKLTPPTDSFAGKTILITGGSGAVCGAAARMIIDLGADTIVLACRSIPEAEGSVKREKLERLLGAERLGGSGSEEQQKQKQKRKMTRVLVWKLDLLSFEGTIAFAQRADRELNRLDGVVMGAATVILGRRFTIDGWEQMLQTIHLSSALLTILLLPVLRRSAEKHGARGVLTNVTSMAARPYGATFPRAALPGRTLLDTLSVGRGRRRDKNMYGEAKLAHLAWLRELCRRLQPGGGGAPADGDESGGGREGAEEAAGGEARGGGADPIVAVHAVDFLITKPGVGLTKVDRMSTPIAALFGRPLDTCAMPVVYSCVPRPGTHGKLFIDYDAGPYPKFLDTGWGEKMQRAVWEETEKLLSRLSPVAKLELAALQT